MARRASEPHPPRRLRALRWAAAIGPVTAEALAEHEGASTQSARALLCAAARRALLSRSRPLTAAPELFAVTRSGLRASGLRGMDPPRVTAANAAHATACAAVAAALGARYPDHYVLGEPALRAHERGLGAPLACARLVPGARPGATLHRPDLVLVPNGPACARPLAVEVELTLKAPRRLLAICRAWARCEQVRGVLYLATPEVERALRRALLRAAAGGRVAVVPLAALAPASALVPAPVPAPRSAPGPARP